MKGYVTLIMIILMLSILSIPAFAQTPEDTTKVIIVNLNIKDDKFTEIGKEVKYSHPPNLGLQREHFRVKLLSLEGSVIKEFGVWDPRIKLGDEVVYYENGTLGPLIGKLVLEDDVDFVIIIPFFNNSKTLEIYDIKTGEQLISVDLRNRITEFCEQNKEDPDCKKLLERKPPEKPETPKPIPINFITMGILIIVILGVLVVLAVIFSKKKKK